MKPISRSPNTNSSFSKINQVLQLQANFNWMS